MIGSQLRIFLSESLKPRLFEFSPAIVIAVRKESDLPRQSHDDAVFPGKNPCGKQQFIHKDSRRFESAVMVVIEKSLDARLGFVAAARLGTIGVIPHFNHPHRTVCGKGDRHRINDLRFTRREFDFQLRRGEDKCLDGIIGRQRALYDDFFCRNRVCSGSIVRQAEKQQWDDRK